MLFSTSVLAIALSMANVVQGLVVERSPAHEICYTTMGTQSVKNVLTSSHTVTSTATKTEVYHVQSKTTIAAPVVTTTATEASIQVKIDAAGTETGTATVKTTVVGTTTKTVTIHPTVTKTKTVTTTVHSTKTSTVPTSPGFVPISTSLPNSNKARDLVQSKPKLSRKNGKYPQNVDCKNIETVTTTVTSTTTDALETVTAEAPTAVHTTTQVTISTAIVHPNAKVAITSVVSSTKTVTITKTAPATTKTITKTSTTTDVSPGPTIYAACAAQNLMPQFQQQNIDGITGNYGNEVLVSATDLYLCCVACFESPSTCAVGNHDGDDPTDCWLYTNPKNQCGPQKSFNYEAFSCNYNGIGAFNGNCGEINTFVNFGACD